MKNRKSCFVPICNNNNIKKPEKIFLSVPLERDVRKLWCKAVNFQNMESIKWNRNLYCCEDHFDFATDFSNLDEFGVSTNNLLLKKDVLPHKHITCCKEISDSQVLNSQQIKEIKRGLRCCIIHCKSDSVKFPFPSEEEFEEKWRNALTSVEYVFCKESKLCALHFRPEDIETEELYLNNILGVLIKASLPYPQVRKGALPCYFSSQESDSEDDVQINEDDFGCASEIEPNVEIIRVDSSDDDSDGSDDVTFVDQYSFTDDPANENVETDDVNIRENDNINISESQIKIEEHIIEFDELNIKQENDIFNDDNVEKNSDVLENHISSQSDCVMYCDDDAEHQRSSVSLKTSIAVASNSKKANTIPSPKDELSTLPFYTVSYLDAIKTKLLENSTKLVHPEQLHSLNNNKLAKTSLKKGHPGNQLTSTSIATKIMLQGNQSISKKNSYPENSNSPSTSFIYIVPKLISNNTPSTKSNTLTSASSSQSRNIKMAKSKSKRQLGKKAMNLSSKSVNKNIGRSLSRPRKIRMAKSKSKGQLGIKIIDVRSESVDNNIDNLPIINVPLTPATTETNKTSPLFPHANVSVVSPSNPATWPVSSMVAPTISSMISPAYTYSPVSTPPSANVVFKQTPSFAIPNSTSGIITSSVSNTSLQQVLPTFVQSNMLPSSIAAPTINQFASTSFMSNQLPQFVMAAPNSINMSPFNLPKTSHPIIMSLPVNASTLPLMPSVAPSVVLPQSYLTQNSSLPIASNLSPMSSIAPFILTAPSNAGFTSL